MATRTPPRGDRGSAAAALAICAAIVILLAAALTGTVAGVIAQQAPGCQAQPPPSAAAAAIPANYLALYQRAGRAYGIPWTILAAIGDIESGHGQNDGPSSAGALGPMQFMPSTWATYGQGGDIWNPADAIPAAARLLAAKGAPANMPAALFAYNHATWYVNEVLAQAARYSAGGAQAVTAASGPACQLAAIGPLPAGAAGKVIAFALAQIGRPYQWGGTGPGAYDCSGLTMMAYRAAGIFIPRTASQQWQLGPRVPAGQEQPGDLVFFAGADGTAAHPGHVGLVIGRGLMAEAFGAGVPIRITPYAGRGAIGFTRP